MLTKTLERKLKKEGVKEYKKWYKLFMIKNYNPFPMSKKDREILAHNFALLVVWNK